MVQSEVSIFRGLVFVSISVVSILFAYKLGKDHNRTDTLYELTQPKEVHFALKEGQTILGVIDKIKAMCFYPGLFINLKNRPEKAILWSR